MIWLSCDVFKFRVCGSFCVHCGLVVRMGGAVWRMSVYVHVTRLERKILNVAEREIESQCILSVKYLC